MIKVIPLALFCAMSTAAVPYALASDVTHEDPTARRATSFSETEKTEELAQKFYNNQIMTGKKNWPINDTATIEQIEKENRKLVDMLKFYAPGQNFDYQYPTYLTTVPFFNQYKEFLENFRAKRQAELEIYLNGGEVYTAQVPVLISSATSDPQISVSEGKAELKTPATTVTEKAADEPAKSTIPTSPMLEPQSVTSTSLSSTPTSEADTASASAPTPVVLAELDPQPTPTSKPVEILEPAEVSAPAPTPVAVPVQIPVPASVLVQTPVTTPAPSSLPQPQQAKQSARKDGTPFTLFPGEAEFKVKHKKGEMVSVETLKWLGKLNPHEDYRNYSKSKIEAQLTTRGHFNTHKLKTVLKTPTHAAKAFTSQNN